MISRPVVAAPLAGWLVGVPETGMWVGALLEILSLRQLPVGASRGWDTGPAAVAAAAAAANLPAGAFGLVISLGLGAAVAWLGSLTIHLMRLVNTRIVVRSGPMSPSELGVRHLSAMAIDFARAASLTLLALTFTIWLAAGIAEGSGIAARIASLLLTAVVGLSMAVSVRTMAAGRAAEVAFAAGAVLSALVWLWLV